MASSATPVFVAGRDAAGSVKVQPLPSGDDTVIIFDWDDTLFPSWFVREVVTPCMPQEQFLTAPVTEESPFYQTLAEHARVVEDTLRLARSFGRVSIVTLATLAWVEESASRFLPGLDLDELLESLEISVHCARDNVIPFEVVEADFEGGVNLWTVAKDRAMRRMLRGLSRRGVRWNNVLSIGDSLAERDAIVDVLWSHEQEMSCDVLCKTVKLLDEPSLKELGAQLRTLLAWLSNLVAHDSDFELVLADSAE